MRVHAVARSRVVTPRAVAGAADFPGLHAAGGHLEFATRLDHRSSCRGRCQSGQTLASHPAFFLGFFVHTSRAVEPDFLRRRALGHVRFLEAMARTPFVALHFLHERAGVFRLLALFVSLAHFAELARGRRAADVLSDGPLLE